MVGNKMSRRGIPCGANICRCTAYSYGSWSRIENIYLKKKKKKRFSPYSSMLSWFTGTDKTSRNSSNSNELMHSDYTGIVVPPPEVPKTIQRHNVKLVDTFTGFTPPPFSEENDFDNEEQPNKTILDGFLIKAHSLLDTTFQPNARLRNCWTTVKSGSKMGAIVGACFGTFTGLYGVVQHRSLALLPVSVLGGSASFAFFLGCGMLVRCNTHASITPPKQA